MAKQVFETPDLLRMIYGFGPLHRAQMAEVYAEEPAHPIQDFPEFQERFNLFYRLVRCHCCSRHSHRKPWIYVKDGILFCDTEYGPRVPEDKNMHDCRCACRKQARQLQRHIQVKMKSMTNPETFVHE